MGCSSIYWSLFKFFSFLFFFFSFPRNEDYTPEYRSSSTATTMELINVQQDKTFSGLTYASIMQKVSFPIKEEALIFYVYEDISIKEYTSTIGQIINSINI